MYSIPLYLITAPLLKHCKTYCQIFGLATTLHWVYRVFRQKLDTFGRLQLGRWPSYHAGHHLIGCRISRSFFWGAARQGPTSFDRAIAFFLKKSFFLQISIKLIFDIFRGLLKLHFWICRTVRNYVIFPIIILKMIHLPNSHTFFFKALKMCDYT